MMYYCRDCKDWFKEPDISRWVEPHGEEWAIELCPACKSDNVTKVATCACGDGCSEGKYWCDRCHDKIGWWLNEARKDLNISIDELGDLIAEHYGW